MSEVAIQRGWRLCQNMGKVFVTTTCTRFSYLRRISSQRKLIMCTKDFV